MDTVCPGYRILVVDDEPVTRALLKRMLETSNSDFRVEEAENGVAARVKIPVFSPHLVVLDLVMPEMDGEELCRSIKSSSTLAQVKVLVLTGSQDNLIFRNALADGADAWLRKPVAVDVLLNQVNVLLGIKPTMRNNEFSQVIFPSG